MTGYLICRLKLRGSPHVGYRCLDAPRCLT